MHLVCHGLIRGTRSRLHPRSIGRQPAKLRVTPFLSRVDLELPKVEVAYRNLTVEANVYVGSRALPTLLNSVRNAAEVTTCRQFIHP
jgi:hypothetical protein